MFCLEKKISFMIGGIHDKVCIFQLQEIQGFFDE